MRRSEHASSPAPLPPAAADPPAQPHGRSEWESAVCGVCGVVCVVWCVWCWGVVCVVWGCGM